MTHCQNLPPVDKMKTATLLKRADEICHQRGARLSEIRRRALQLLSDEYKPLGAYELLDRLRHTMNRSFSPPTVYRALEFLLTHRLIARIESRNAFIVRADPLDEHDCIFLTCEQCGAVLELPHAELGELLDSNAIARGFAVTDKVLEIRGACSNSPPERLEVTASSLPAGAMPAPPRRKASRQREPSSTSRHSAN